VPIGIALRANTAEALLIALITEQCGKEVQQGRTLRQPLRRTRRAP
jgi:hypothetical protein